MKEFFPNSAVYLALYLTGLLHKHLSRSCLQYRAAARASDCTDVDIEVLNLLRSFTCCHLKQPSAKQKLQ